MSTDPFGGMEQMNQTTRGPVRPARRLTVRRWRDPRLLAGVALVVGATAVGARVMATQDDTEQYWAVRSSVVAGDRVERDDLELRRAQLRGVTRDQYLGADDELPAALDELVWSQDLDDGVLIHRTAWHVGDDGVGQLPLRVAAGAFPVDLVRGDVVDVWVGPGPGQEGGAAAQKVLAQVRVVDAGEQSTTLGGDVARTVLVSAADDVLDGASVARLASGHVTVVRVG